MARRQVSRGDIARLAGVSGAAVSYALSGKDAYRISTETRERIRKIAEELGYKPSFAGRTLSSGRSYSVGALLPSEHLLSSQHIMAILKGIAGRMSRTDYILTLFYRGEFKKCLDSIESRRIDGLFVIRGEDLCLKEFPEGFPIVNIDGFRDLPEAPNVCNVRADHEAMTREAVEYFASKSCRNLLGIFEGSPHSASRQFIPAEAFATECARNASRIFGSCLSPGRNFSAQMKGMLESGRKWDAFLINNDCLSNLCIDALDLAGLKEGSDYQMIVYSTGNQRFSCNSYRNKVRCKLLYVEQEDGIGAQAWDAFEALLKNSGHESRHLVPYKLWKKPRKPFPCFWNSETLA